MKNLVDATAQVIPILQDIVAPMTEHASAQKKIEGKASVTLKDLIKLVPLTGILLMALAACGTSSVASGTNSPSTGDGQAPGSTTTSVPNLKFTGAFPGLVVAPADCTPSSDSSRSITWSDDELWTNVSKTASNNTFVNTMQIDIPKYQGSQAYPLIQDGTTTSATGAYAQLSLQFGDDQRLYVPSTSNANTISVAADEKSGTLTATLVNSADPTDIVTITGSWTCVIVP